MLAQICGKMGMMSPAILATVDMVATVAIWKDHPYCYSQVGSIRATWPWARLLPLDLTNGSVKVRSKFQALWPLASRARGRARARPP